MENGKGFTAKTQRARRGMREEGRFFDRINRINKIID
jgi:hypothetical protein